MKLSKFKTKIAVLVLIAALCFSGITIAPSKAKAATDYVTLLEKSGMVTAYIPISYTFNIPTAAYTYIDVLVLQPTDLICSITSSKGETIFVDVVLSTDVLSWKYSSSMGLYTYGLDWPSPDVGDYTISLTFAASIPYIIFIDQEVASYEPTLPPTPMPTPTLPPTPTPTPGMGVTFAPITPTPSPTLSPTPTPTPTASPTPTPTPTPELGVSASQTELSADAQGTFGSNKVDLAVTNSYSCTVSSSDSWLKVCKKNASASAGSTIWLSGDGKEWTESFYVFAYENTSAVPRTGEITITAEYGDKTATEKVVVKQEAAKAVLDVSTKKITANAKGKTSVSSVKVDTNKTGGFSVSNNGNSWIKVGSSSYSGSASSNVSFEAAGTFYVFVSENPSDEARTGQVTVTHEDGETTETIEVVQEGTKAVLTVDSTSKTADDSGYFYNNAISVKTSRTGAFTAAVEDAGWLKISTERNPSFADGMDSITLDGDGYIYLVAEKNTGSERTATITISHAGGEPV